MPEQNQPHPGSRIFDSQIKSCGTIPPRVVHLPGSFTGLGKSVPYHYAAPQQWLAGLRKVFRRVTRSWTSRILAHRPRGLRASRSACFFSSGFSHFPCSIPSCTGTASDTTLTLARLSSSTICDSKRTGGTPIKIFLSREPSPAVSLISTSTRRPGTSATFSPSGRPSFGLHFCWQRTPSYLSPTLLARISLPMVFPLLISWPWPLAPQPMVSLACFFPIFLPESTSKSAGPFSPLLPSGAPVRFPFICISIRPGPTRILHLPLLSFSGIGCARAIAAPFFNGFFSGFLPA